MIDEEENKKLAISKLDSFTNTEEMLNFAQVLIKSNLVPSNLNLPEKVVTVILQGKELGFGAVTSLNCINNIQGKPTLSVHAIAALIKKAGIKYKLISDFETTKKSDGSFDIDANGKPKDKITTIRFYETFNNIIIENDVSYCWSDAIKSGYTIKDNWIKMPKIMMRTRCLAIGARFVAPHAILGLYETSEMLDVHNKNYNITEEGELTIINN